MSYTQGLYVLGEGAFAYLLPDGGWSLSNAGIIADSGEALVIDTLIDRRSTEGMLSEFRRAMPRTEIGRVVNTHSHPDHTWGNWFFRDREIIASAAALADFSIGDLARAMPRIRAASSADHDGVKFLKSYLELKDVDRTGMSLVKPNRTFEGTLELRVGEKLVRLTQVGPAHSSGDIIAHVPANKIVFTGDILFAGHHPVLGGDSSFEGWLSACDLILGLDVETVVPGHGYLAKRADVLATRDYLIALQREVKTRYDAGLSREDAAAEIAQDYHRDWGCRERIAASVAYLYHRLAQEKTDLDLLELLGSMHRLAGKLRSDAKTTAHVRA